LNERIVSLYARGMTVRDIRDHLAEIYQVDVSPDFISRVTDAVWAECKDWQSRPLDRAYPVIYLDAIVCKVRDQGVVGNKAAHIAVGIDVEGAQARAGHLAFRPTRAPSSGSRSATSYAPAVFRMC